MNITTYDSGPYTKARSANDFGAAFEWSRESLTKTEPTGDGVHSFSVQSPSQIQVALYGQGNPFSGFWARIHCWSVAGNSPTWIWARSTVAEIGCVLSVMPELTGLDGCIIGPGERFGGTAAGYQYSFVNLPPCQKIAFEFLGTSKTPVGMNALWRKIY